MRRLLLVALVAVALVASGDGVSAATCKPLAQGTCNACTKCNSCKHCSKNGGTCSVCKKRK